MEKPAQKIKVLVIDDENDFCMITKLNLEDSGAFEVQTLPDGKDILAELRNFKPDIILLDMLIPKFSGEETCKLLNTDPLGKNVPIIVVSALDKDRDKLKAYKLGIVDYLVKPVDKQELIDKIGKSLRFKIQP